MLILIVVAIVYLSSALWSSSSAPLALIDSIIYNSFIFVFIIDGKIHRHDLISVQYICYAEDQQPKYSIRKTLRAAFMGIASTVELCLIMLNPLSCQQHPPCSRDFSHLAFGILLAT